MFLFSPEVSEFADDNASTTKTNENKGPDEIKVVDDEEGMDGVSSQGEKTSGGNDTKSDVSPVSTCVSIIPITITGKQKSIDEVAEPSECKKICRKKKIAVKRQTSPLIRNKEKAEYQFFLPQASVILNRDECDQLVNSKRPNGNSRKENTPKKRKLMNW